jgi:serine kinase of HPr protein (carbohydrate metabolism regulator)
VTLLAHATCIALRSRGRSSVRTWRAALLRGPSGAGKSDLALRLIEAGARLVADDQTRIVRKGRVLFAAAPIAIAGLIEVRGIGIMKLARSLWASRAPLSLLVDLVPADRIERLPELAEEAGLGVNVPVLALAPFEISAVAKLQLALAQISTA